MGPFARADERRAARDRGARSARKTARGARVAHHDRSSLAAALGLARRTRGPRPSTSTTRPGRAGSEMLEIARTELGAARVARGRRPRLGRGAAGGRRPRDRTRIQAMDADDTAGFMKAGGRLADPRRLRPRATRRSRASTSSASRPRRARSPRCATAPPSRSPSPSSTWSRATRRGRTPSSRTSSSSSRTTRPALRHPNLSPVLRIRAIGEPDVILAVAGQVGKGRLFAMSDPSAIINQMLRYPGNRAFVAGLVRYLVDDDGAQRRQGRLFIVTNRFGEEGIVRRPGASLRKDLESQLKSRSRPPSPRRGATAFPGWAHVALAAVAALGLAAWVARASARPYKSPLPRYARPHPARGAGRRSPGRFAVLAAPPSPRSLALLELKSALFEGLAGEARAAPPSRRPTRSLDLVDRAAGALDERAYSALKEVLAHDAARSRPRSSPAGPARVPRERRARRPRRRCASRPRRLRPPSGHGCSARTSRRHPSAPMPSEPPSLQETPDDAGRCRRRDRRREGADRRAAARGDARLHRRHAHAST